MTSLAGSLGVDWARRSSHLELPLRVRREKRSRLRWLQAIFFCCCANEIGGLAKTSAGSESKTSTTSP